MSGGREEPAWLKGAKKIWEEDDSSNARSLPGHETLGAAWRRIFGEDLIVSEVKDGADFGDTFYYLYDRAIRYNSYEGDSIWVNAEQFARMSERSLAEVSKHALAELYAMAKGRAVEGQKTSGGEAKVRARWCGTLVVDDRSTTVASYSQSTTTPDIIAKWNRRFEYPFEGAYKSERLARAAIVEGLSPWCTVEEGLPQPRVVVTPEPACLTYRNPNAYAARESDEADDREVSDEEIERALQLDAKATEGPWECEDTQDASCGRPCTPDGCHEGHPSGWYYANGPEVDDGEPSRYRKGDAEFIAEARILLPKFVRELKRLRSAPASREEERTPERVLRAMLRAYNDAALDQAVLSVGDEDRDRDRALWDLEELVDVVRVSLAHCIAGGGAFLGASDDFVERDYEARMSGARPIDARPPEGGSES